MITTSCSVFRVSPIRTKTRQSILLVDPCCRNDSMYTGKTPFAQIMDYLLWKNFHRIVSRYDGDHRVRTLPCAEHFRALAYAQLTYRESLRDIEACLSAQSKLYHIGIGPHQALYSGRCQRKKRLANLRRVCTTADHGSSKTLCGRGSWAGPGKHCLCTGLHLDRS